MPMERRSQSSPAFSADTRGVTGVTCALPISHLVQVGEQRVVSEQAPRPVLLIDDDAGKPPVVSPGLVAEVVRLVARAATDVRERSQPVEAGSLGDGGVQPIAAQ